mmetsp:Transcript_29194/g.94181  ORF Transcript_29194/g.94181 Transcript_29194/m.94181 type:complete len:326 (-) Transcript_29194:174-1151(-)
MSVDFAALGFGVILGFIAALSGVALRRRRSDEAQKEVCVRRALLARSEHLLRRVDVRQADGAEAVSRTGDVAGPGPGVPVHPQGPERGGRVLGAEGLAVRVGVRRGQGGDRASPGRRRSDRPGGRRGDDGGPAERPPPRVQRGVRRVPRVDRAPRSSVGLRRPGRRRRRRRGPAIPRRRRHLPRRTQRPHDGDDPRRPPLRQAEGASDGPLRQLRRPRPPGRFAPVPRGGKAQRRRRLRKKRPRRLLGRPPRRDDVLRLDRAPLVRPRRLLPKARRRLRPRQRRLLAPHDRRLEALPPRRRPPGGPRQPQGNPPARRPSRQRTLQ